MEQRLIGSAACGSCKFAVPDSRSGALACRRMPPIAHPIIAAGKDGKPVMAGQAALFPQVHPSMWCGEFKRDLASAIVEGQG